MKISSSYMICLMSGILLVLVTSIKAEYEWNGTEWVWKDGPADSEGSGDMAYDEEDTEEEESYGNYDDDEDNYDGSGDDTSPNRGRDNEPKNNFRDNSNSDRDRNLNSNSNNYDGSKYDVQITSAPETPYDPYSNGDLDRQQNNNFPEDIIVDPPKTTFPSPVENNNNNNVNRNQNNFGTRSPTSFFAQPGTMAAVIGGAVVGLLCAILCVMFVVYRMRKKDEGSYALDEPKRSPTVNSYSKPPSREFYA